jgi:5,10-methenyltetrahydromethanopterin hydrogenase
MRFFVKLLLPDGCCHLLEVTDQSTLLTANLLLVDTDLVVSDIEGSADKSAIVIKIIFDNIEEHIRVARLETLPTANSESLSSLRSRLRIETAFVCLVPTYVKAIVGILMDSDLDDEAFEAMVMQQKIKYLK